ncbi:tyrosine-type recombinase/integrase [Halopiger aswanensis]|uniref:Phage integrase family protein with SAM-like domain n=1 Tax=Halopiger aswanensis TaxID=148449 RepID=A0A3R7DZX5_9EURY|nr:tyrosine-type recombinase/integrase [Halopiger aswanensis]RKD95622.1 phage integrase family protein with SAM-like domain [Halopiger aswanensis]
MSEDQLESIHPTEAFELYLDERRSEVTPNTLQAHRYRIRHFLRWCEKEDITDLNELTGRQLHEYKVWRRKEGDLNNVTVKTQMDTLRVFIKFCESIDAVPSNLHEKVLSPKLNRGDNQSNDILREEEAHSLLDYLYRFEYASFPHVLIRLLWTTGMRIGAAYSLDIEDYHSDDRFLEIRHRESTPLKNKEEGERLVALDPETCEVLSDWINHQRPSSQDDEGREPLLATVYGRAHKNTLRKTVYQWTRPCEYTGTCPHGRGLGECEALNDNQKSPSLCPSSVAPHAIRRGSITYHLTKNVLAEVVSNRMNVSQKVLDIHYDKRSEETKMEQRRRYLEDRPSTRFRRH